MCYKRCDLLAIPLICVLDLMLTVPTALSVAESAGTADSLLCVTVSTAVDINITVASDGGGKSKPWL